MLMFIHEVVHGTVLHSTCADIAKLDPCPCMHVHRVGFCVGDVTCIVNKVVHKQNVMGDIIII